jgi:hypothetical protein
MCSLHNHADSFEGREETLWDLVHYLMSLEER